MSSESLLSIDRDVGGSVTSESPAVAGSVNS